MVLADQVNDLQQQSLAVLGSVIPRGRPVALVDYPAYLNPGDTLIHRGQLVYLNRLGVRVDYLSAVHTHDDALLREHVPDGPILLQGGGNFGDRYPRHQRFREHIVSTHPDRRVVAMPQTMDYADDANLDRTRRIYAAHPDLHVLIRDRDGFDRARSVFADNHVHFCPDSAFGCGLISPSSPPRDDVVVLRRVDGESRHSATPMPDRLVALGDVTDWTIGHRGNAKWWLSTHAATGMHRLGRLRARAYPHMIKGFDRQAEINVRSAVEIISRGRVVVTDRLHAAILATLTGKPVIMVDNSNHKLSAAHRSYLGEFADTHLAEDFDAAADLVPTVLASMPTTAARPPAAPPAPAAR